MAETIPSSWIDSKSDRVSMTAWVWLVEINFPESEYADAIRIAINTSSVTWNGVIWYPYDLKLGEMTTDADGGSGRIRITSKHADRQLETRFTNTRGFVDRNCRIRYVDLSDLTVLESEVPFVLARIRLVTSDSGSGVQWELSTPSFLKRTLPWRRFSPTHCEWKYGSEMCGAPVTIPGFPKVCDKTKNGDQGCDQKGAYEVLNGYEKLHPARRGAFPFIAIPGL